jgi:hypothetical protein
MKRGGQAEAWRPPMAPPTASLVRPELLNDLDVAVVRAARNRDRHDPPNAPNVTGRLS